MLFDISFNGLSCCEELLVVVIKLFVVCGYYGIWMDDVVDVIGFNKVMVYYYYVSKLLILFDIYC